MKNSLLENLYGITELHVSPGLYCNFSCSHCGNNSHSKQKNVLTEEELQSLINDIKMYSPNKLLFTRGEPTFHIDLINKIILAHPDCINLKVTITSNGWYAKRHHLLNEVLSKFIQLDCLQISLDKYHEKPLTINELRILDAYCHEKGIQLSVLSCIESPMDILEIEQLKSESAIPINFHKAESCGRAFKNNIGFHYETFDDEVLDRKCPNIGQVSYLCNKGYSICCSNLIYNHDFDFVRHQSLGDHLSSEFYKNISKLTFRDLAKLYAIKLSHLPAEFSSPCRLCEHIHCHGTN